MPALGYKLMSEEHGPEALIRNGIRAEQAGFDFAAISDHFSPWLEEQGHSPFAWAVLGALAHATGRIGLMTAVTCPTVRYHPAIVAQAAATIALISGDRFTLGLGSGERLNEHVTGEGWPMIGERHRRLVEASEIIQGLLAGNITHYRGEYFHVEDARLFDRPERKPKVVIAAAGAEAARIAARSGDGLVTTQPKAEIVKAFTEAGGGGPRFAEVAICYAAREEEAQQTAHHYYRWSEIGGPTMMELPDAKAFAAASSHITPDIVAKTVPCGPSPDRHLKVIEKYVEAGFDHLILMQIGPDQDSFFNFFERELAPRLRGKKAA